MKKIIRFVLVISVILSMIFCSSVIAMGDASSVVSANPTGNSTDVKPIVVKSGSCRNYTRWDFYDNGELVISGSGDMDDYDYLESADHLEKTPWFNYAESITKVTIGNSVKSIGDYSFAYLKNLREVSIGKDVTEIGAYAFAGCFNLEKFVIPSGVKTVSKYAFYNSGLTDIYIPDSVTTFGNSVFSKCSELKKVHVLNLYEYLKINSDGSGNISSFPFTNGADLYFYGISNGVISKDEFVTEITVPRSIKTIQNYSFNGCTSLEKIVFLGDTQEIGKSAFKNCTSLKEIEFPKSLKKIWNTAFSGCENLTQVVFNQGLESINKGAFQNDKAIESLSFPDSLVKIGAGAFSGCSGLKSVCFGNERTVAENTSFESFSIKASNVKDKSVTISWTGFNKVLKTEIKLNDELVSTIVDEETAQHTFNNLEPDKMYKVTVTVYYDDKTSFSSSVTVSTKLSKGYLGELTSKRNKITAVWQRTGRASYELQIAKDSDFSKGKKTFDVESGTNTYTVKDLKKGTTYYVRERAVLNLDSGTVYGKWSNVKKIICK